MEEYDVIIRNGKVVDGTGAPWSKLDVGIKGERIAKVMFSIPEKAPVGIEYVLINGKVVLEKGEYHKDVLAGKVLRGPGYLGE